MLNVGMQHFRMVFTIVREGSLTRAAEALHLTQSALSHQLKELERELDTAVFLRRGKKMMLTDEGARFLSSAEKILAEVASLEEDISSYKEGKTGRIAISTQCYTAYHWLPCILKHFRQASPDISVHIMSEATFRPMDYLLNGQLDVGIVKTKTENPDVHYEEIFDDRLFAVMHRDHPLSTKELIEIADFQDEELFMAFADPSKGHVPIIETLMQLQGVTARKVHHIHYTDAIIEMLNANLGISVMANWIVYPYLRTKDIVVRPLPPEVGNRTWYAATCKDNPAIRNFLRCLKNHFPEIIRKANREVYEQQEVSALAGLIA